MSFGIEDIERAVGEGIPESEVRVQGMGGKFLVRVVSDHFAGLNAVKRQQSVYRVLNPHIASGEIHAVSMELLTRSEAEGQS